MVATDLDGTLLMSSGVPSSSSVRALCRLRGRGIVTVAVTARPQRLYRDIESRIPVDFVICDNGATTLPLGGDPALPKVVLLSTVDLGAAIRDIRAVVPRASFALETPAGTIAETTFLTMAASELDARSCIETDRITKPPPATKLMVVVADALSPEALCEMLRGSWAPTHSGGCYVEIGPPGVTKAGAVADLCGRLGIRPQEVVAFGDMPNDIELLRWSGLGVAMGNAHPDVLAVADWVTLSNDEHGVAAFLDGDFSQTLEFGDVCGCR